jgi:hypothetical protein
VNCTVNDSPATLLNAAAPPERLEFDPLIHPDENTNPGSDSSNRSNTGGGGGVTSPSASIASTTIQSAFDAGLRVPLWVMAIVCGPSPNPVASNTTCWKATEPGRYRSTGS